jgi:hypothetical protein
MNAKVLVAGVAIVVMAAGASSAKTHRHSMHHSMHGHSMSEDAYAAPAEPIPYAQMDTYMSSHHMTSGAEESHDMKPMHGMRHGHAMHGHKGKMMKSGMSKDSMSKDAMPSDTAVTPPPS